MTAEVDLPRSAGLPAEVCAAVGHTALRAGRGEAPNPSCRLSAPARLLVLFLRFWRWTAPMRLPRCRFEPSCSVYAQESIRQYGAARGAWRALRRIVRCNPWNPGGVDPVD